MRHRKLADHLRKKIHRPHGAKPIDLPARPWLDDQVATAVDALDQAQQQLEDYRTAHTGRWTADALTEERRLDRAVDDARQAVYDRFRERRGEIHTRAAEGRQKAAQRLLALHSELTEAAVDYLMWERLATAGDPRPVRGRQAPGQAELAVALDGGGGIGGLAAAVAAVQRSERSEQGVAA